MVVFVYQDRVVVTEGAENSYVVMRVEVHVGDGRLVPQILVGSDPVTCQHTIDQLSVLVTLMNLWDLKWYKINDRYRNQ